ncbi:hypothetical protein ABZP36_003987 [Zizania latifolia]
MSNEHYFPGEYFSASSSAGAAYAPAPGLDVAAAFGMAPSWGPDQMMVAADSAAHFDSALSSLVSSPAGGGGGGFVNGGAGGDDMAIGDLIGRLGSICNGASANNSCYSTPLSSPPRGPPPPPPLTTTAFRGYGATLETGGRLSRVSSSKSLGTHPAAAAPLETSETEMSPAPTTPATTDPPAPEKVPTGSEGSARKRKGSAKGKASSSLPMATAATTATPKRSKVTGGGDDEAPEPPKDYIHVRARRGQATDSHSLAERVRRERISERMKLLQSLVPGCNKITGKALMLDEIINYVQSLQRQVEFLSMKLATMNPQLELEGHYLPSKDMSNVSMATYLCGDPTTTVAAAFSYAGEAAGDLFATYNCWDVDLQTVGATAGGVTQDGPTAAASPSPLPHALRPSHGFYGQQQQGTTVNHMKAEP